MNTKVYANEYGDEFIIEELSRKEFIEAALSGIEAIEEYGDDDSHVYVVYKDGSVLDCLNGFETKGRFRKTGIKFGCVDNGSTQQVFGVYEVDENGIVQGV